MLENHINRIIEFCDTLFDQKEFYYNEDLNQIEDMPMFLRRYINSFINHKIESDLQKIKELSYYDFSDEKSFDFLDKLNSTFKERIFLSREQLKLIIEDIIHLHFNFLIRPRNTLLFNFQKDSNILISSIIEKYLVFNNYEYLINAIFHKLNDNLSVSNEIEYKELELIIEDIDNEFIFGKTAADFIELVEPIYNLFDIFDKDTNEQIVPTEALMIFFDDKSLLPIVELLETKYNNENLKFISKGQLLDILLEILDSISDEDSVEIDNVEINSSLIGISEIDNEVIENQEVIENDFIIDDFVDDFVGEITDEIIETKDDEIPEIKSEVILEDEFLQGADIDSGKIDANDLSQYGFDLSDFEDIEEDELVETDNKNDEDLEENNDNFEEEEEIFVVDKLLEEEKIEVEEIYTESIDIVKTEPKELEIAVYSSELNDLNEIINSTSAFNENDYSEFEFDNDDNSIDLNELDELLK